MYKTSGKSATHPIAEEYSDHFLPTQPWLVERNQGLLNVLKDEFDNYQKAVNETARLDKGLKDEVRAERQHKTLNEAKKAFKGRITEAVNQLHQDYSQAKENLRLKTQPKEFESSSEKLAYEIHKLGTMMQLQGMKQKDILTLAEQQVLAGDRTLLDIITTGFAKPLVDNPDKIQAIENRYQRTVAQDELNQLEIEEQVLQSAKVIQQKGERYLRQLDREDDRILPAPEGPRKSEIADWTAQQKSEFISQHGQDNFLKVMNGEAQLSDFTEE